MAYIENITTFVYNHIVYVLEFSSSVINSNQLCPHIGTSKSKVRTALSISCVFTRPTVRRVAPS